MVAKFAGVAREHEFERPFLLAINCRSPQQHRFAQPDPGFRLVHVRQPARMLAVAIEEYRRIYSAASRDLKIGESRSAELDGQFSVWAPHGFKTPEFRQYFARVFTQTDMVRFADQNRFARMPE